MGVNDTGSGNFGGESFVTLGDFDFGSRADRNDFPIGPAKDEPLFDRLKVASHREEEICFNGDLGVGNCTERKKKKEFKHVKRRWNFLAIEAAALGLAIMAGAVAAFGEEAILRVIEVEDLLAFNVGFENTGVD